MIVLLGKGNIIGIGPYFCDPIPLHCTEAQIACKTRPMKGLLGEWTGSTDSLPVTVTVDGVESVSCGAGCTFKYESGWYHTPRVYDVTPRSVYEGTIISVGGRFHRTPFEFDELKAPAMEVPLASVKVANPPGELQQAQNEPFGQSGTRCALFDHEIEEPYGVTLSDNAKLPDEVTDFKCQINGPRQAGRYNLSVALLGTAMIPDSNMYFGEAQVISSMYQSDHNGVSFMIQQVPRIESITPTRSGVLGGARVTILGQSFSTDERLVRISVSGTPCRVETASLEMIVCSLDAVAPESPSHFPEGSLQVLQASARSQKDSASWFF